MRNRVARQSARQVDEFSVDDHLENGWPFTASYRYMSDGTVLCKVGAEADYSLYARNVTSEAWQTYKKERLSVPCRTAGHVLRGWELPGEYRKH